VTGENVCAETHEAPQWASVACVLAHKRIEARLTAW